MTGRRPKSPSAEAGRVGVAVEVFVREVVPAIEEKLAPFLADGERLPDLALLAELLRRRVEWRRERLEAAEVARTEAQFALVMPRRQRDEARGRLRGLLSNLRDLFRGLSRRRPRAGLLGLGGATPQQPLELLWCVRGVQHQLRAPRPPLLEVSDVAFDPEKLASAFDEDAEALRRALAELGARTAEAALAQEVKRRAKAGFKADCGAGLRVLAGLGVLGGKGGLVRLVRKMRIGSR